MAKQWDFERTNQNLAAFAVRCENAEYDIIELYKLWSGDNIKFTCEYPKDFKVNDVTESLNQAQQAKDLDFKSDTFDSEILKKVIDAYMPNLEKETKDMIFKESQAAADEQAQNQTYNDNDLNEGQDDETDEPNA